MAKFYVKVFFLVMVIGEIRLSSKPVVLSKSFNVVFNVIPYFKINCGLILVPFKQSQIIFLQILSTAGTIDSSCLFKKSVKHEPFSEKIPSSKGTGQTNPFATSR